MPILETVQAYGSYKEIAPGEYAGPCPRCGGAMRFRVRAAEDSGKCHACEYAVSGATGSDTAFDTGKMLQLISDTRSRIQNSWDAAGWVWLEANRSDITGFIAQKENAIDPLFGEENEAALVKTLQVLEESYRKAWAIYAERPPVIERQEALFEQSLPAAER